MDKIALDALMKRYRQGQLSDKALNKAIKAGVVRPPERYVEGIEKGTKNIVNQINQRNANLFQEFKVNPIQTKELTKFKDRVRGGGFLSDISTNTIGVSNPKKITHRLTSPLLSLFGRKTRVRGEAAIGARHEAYEMLNAYRPEKALMAIAAGKYAKAQKLFAEKFKAKDPALKRKLGKELSEAEMLSDKAFRRVSIEPKDFKKGVMVKEIKQPKSKIVTKLLSLAGGTHINGKFFMPVGDHQHPEIIAREAEMISKIPYKNITKKIKKARLKTGERQYLTHVLGQDPYERGLPGKWYKKLDRTVSSVYVYPRGGRAVPITKEVINKYPKPQSGFAKALSGLRSFFGKFRR